jgi:predicted dehydrogenase/nucleoside-diphosphate-sugar epimerase
MASARNISGSKLRVGIVGCGRVARHHARFVAQSGMAQIVGLADPDRASAASLGENFGVKNIHGTIEELLGSTPIDVVHIVSPPAHHYIQSAAAIENGSHVLVEKPMTLSTAETEGLYDRAEKKGVLVCPDFIQLFHPLFQQALSTIRSRELGEVVHLDCRLNDNFVGPELKESQDLHWSCKLPGGLLHNYITHLLYLALYWLGSPGEIIVRPRSFGHLPQDLTDYLEIDIEGSKATASIILSCALQPPAYCVKILCERGEVNIDFESATLVLKSQPRLPKAVDRATTNFRQSYQLAIAGLKNGFDFARGKLVPYQGLQNLIPLFYHSIIDRTESPISPELAKDVSKVEEIIFASGGKFQVDTSGRQSRQCVTQAAKVLVTGAAGYVGVEVVRQLVNQGYYVRALVRPLSHTRHLEELGVEIVYGDVRDATAVKSAVKGMEIVVHLAAASHGSDAFVIDTCVNGTRNISDAAKAEHVKRVLYMSSMSVYDYSKLNDGDRITENSPLEEFPEFRGAYSLAKRKAEEIALNQLSSQSPAWTILRPSIIVCSHRDLLSQLGMRVGKFLLYPGKPDKAIRYVSLEDVAHACTRIIKEVNTLGKIYVLSSPEDLTIRQYLRNQSRNDRNHIRLIRIPYWFALLGLSSALALRRSVHQALAVSKARLAVVYRNVSVDSGRLKEQIGFEARIKTL